MAVQKNVLIGKKTLLTLYVIIVILTISSILIYPIYFNYVSAHTHSNSEYNNLSNSASPNTSNSSAYADLNAYISTHIYNNSEYNDLKSYLDNYVSMYSHNNSDYGHLQSMLNLKLTQIIVDNLTITGSAGTFHTETFPVQYAGFILVNLTSSTTDQNTVEVNYTSQWLYYDNSVQIVGYSGIAMFPLVPSSNIQVKIGTSVLSAGGTQTFTITYYF